MPSQCATSSIPASPGNAGGSLSPRPSDFLLRLDRAPEDPGPVRPGSGSHRCVWGTSRPRWVGLAGSGGALCAWLSLKARFRPTQVSGKTTGWPGNSKQAHPGCGFLVVSKQPRAPQLVGAWNCPNALIVCIYYAILIYPGDSGQRSLNPPSSAHLNPLLAGAP